MDAKRTTLIENIKFLSVGTEGGAPMTRPAPDAAPATPAVGDRIFVKEYEALIYFVPPNGVLVNPIRQTTGGYHSTVVQVLAEEIGEDELGKPVYSVSIIDATGREHPVEHVQLLYGK